MPATKILEETDNYASDEVNGLPAVNILTRLSHQPTAYHGARAA